MKVITVQNQKGGSGKTTVVHNLGGALASFGWRVLLIDADEQCNLTNGLVGTVAARAYDPGETSAAIYGGSLPMPHEVIHAVAERIDLVPGSKALSRCNANLPEDASGDLQDSLRDFLPQVERDYDIVMVDCRPDLYLCGWASLVASDYLLVPLAPESYAVQGISDVLDSLARVASSRNPGIELMGIALNRVARKNVHVEYERLLRESFGDKVFEAKIPDSAAFNEALIGAKSVEQHSPRSHAAQAVRQVALELLTRSTLAAASPASPRLKEAS